MANTQQVVHLCGQELAMCAGKLNPLQKFEISVICNKVLMLCNKKMTSQRVTNKVSIV